MSGVVVASYLPRVVGDMALELELFRVFDGAEHERAHDGIDGD